MARSAGDLATRDVRERIWRQQEALERRQRDIALRPRRARRPTNLRQNREFLTRGVTEQYQISRRYFDPSDAGGFQELFERSFREASGGLELSDDARQAMESLAQEATSKLDESHRRARSSARSLIDRVKQSKQTRAAMQQAVGKGVRGFVHRDGKEFRPATYQDQVLRSTSQRGHNAGTLLGASAAGVQAWRMEDGPTCGLTSHEDEEKAAGVIVNFDDGMQYLLAHPNCQRKFVPLPGRKRPKNLKDRHKRLTKDVSIFNARRVAVGGVVGTGVLASGLLVEATLRKKLITDLLNYDDYLAGYSRRISEFVKRVNEDADVDIVDMAGNPITVTATDVVEEVSAWSDRFPYMNQNPPTYVMEILGLDNRASREEIQDAFIQFGGYQRVFRKADLDDDMFLMAEAFDQDIIRRFDDAVAHATDDVLQAVSIPDQLKRNLLRKLKDKGWDFLPDHKVVDIIRYKTLRVPGLEQLKMTVPNIFGKIHPRLQFDPHRLIRIRSTVVQRLDYLKKFEQYGKYGWKDHFRVLRTKDLIDIAADRGVISSVDEGLSLSRKDLVKRLLDAANVPEGFTSSPRDNLKKLVGAYPGIVTRLTINPRGMLRLGFKMSPDGRILPSLSAVPRGPFRGLVAVNRGGSVTTQLRMVLPGKLPNLSVNVNNFNIKSVAAELRIFNRTIGEIAHTFRLKWDDAVKLIENVEHEFAHLFGRVRRPSLRLVHSAEDFVDSRIQYVKDAVEGHEWSLESLRDHANAKLDALQERFAPRVFRKAADDVDAPHPPPGLIALDSTPNPKHNLDEMYEALDEGIISQQFVDDMNGVLNRYDDLFPGAPPLTIRFIEKPATKGGMLAIRHEDLLVVRDTAARWHTRRFSARLEAAFAVNHFAGPVEGPKRLYLIWHELGHHTMNQLTDDEWFQMFRAFEKTGDYVEGGLDQAVARARHVYRLAGKEIDDVPWEELSVDDQHVMMRLIPEFWFEQNQKGVRRMSLYSLANEDEFVAEAFANAMLSLNPSETARIVRREGLVAMSEYALSDEAEEILDDIQDVSGRGSILSPNVRRMALALGALGTVLLAVAVARTAIKVGRTARIYDAAEDTEDEVVTQFRRRHDDLTIREVDDADELPHWRDYLDESGTAARRLDADDLQAPAGDTSILHDSSLLRDYGIEEDQIEDVAKKIDNILATHEDLVSSPGRVKFVLKQDELIPGQPIPNGMAWAANTKNLRVDSNGNLSVLGQVDVLGKWTKEELQDFQKNYDHVVAIDLAIVKEWDNMDRHMRNISSSGWFSDAGVPMAESLVYHELGHTATMSLGAQTRFDIIQALESSGELKIAKRGSLDDLKKQWQRLYLRKIDKLPPQYQDQAREQILHAWILSNRAELQRRLGIYGTYNVDEFFAEVYKTFSTHPNADDWVRLVGTAIRRANEG